MPPTVTQTDLPRLSRRGKVRDIYELGDTLLFVATDRVSAFDVVMNEPIPGKGVVLTQMSRFWLETLPACRPHHMRYVVNERQCPEGYAEYVAQLKGRAMVVTRVDIVPVECVVRGYLAGSGWKAYAAGEAVCGHTLPKGFRRGERLPAPLFTPTTKAPEGQHDEPLTYDEAVETVGRFLAARGGTRWTAAAMAEQLRARTLEIYRQASAHAEARGIILADAKFEFGLLGDELILADEVLTPDSARFWATESYRPGEEPESFDKQVLRNFLETCQGWNKRPPPPTIPAHVIARACEAYQDAYRRLTGQTITF